MACKRVAVLMAYVSLVGLGVSSLQQQQQQQQPQTQQQTEQRQQPFCTLGDDIFEVGERWNPNLPPFGVQVCVLCECTIRQRKSCYETKVTCRRITNECPVIDSCPDGKKPVTVAGQCCKSCQSAPETTTIATTITTTTSSTTIASNSQVSSTTIASKLVQTTAFVPAPVTTTQLPNQIATSTASPNLNYRSGDVTIQTQQPQQQQQQQWYAPVSPVQPTMTSFKLLFLNEKTKEYLAIVRAYPACPSRDQPATSSTSSTNNRPAATTAASPVAKSKDQSGRVDINGIDTRLAFKSLHDSAYPSPSRSRTSSMKANTEPHDDQTRHDHQHPNDFQSTNYAMTNYQISPSNVDQLPSMHNNRTAFNGPTQMCNNRPGVSNSTTSNCDTTTLINKNTHTFPHPNPTLIDYPDRARASHSTRNTIASSAQPLNTCKLGNNTFQIGDMWNPVLPPFGVQVCVECNCILNVRKTCFETRVTCRRTNKDCPKIDSCPDGSLPITVVGQCCKTCQVETQGQAGELLQLENVVQRNEKVLKEYESVSKSMHICAPRRDSNSAHISTKPVARSQSKRSQRPLPR